MLKVGKHPTATHFGALFDQKLQPSFSVKWTCTAHFCRFKVDGWVHKGNMMSSMVAGLLCAV